MAVFAEMNRRRTRVDVEVRTAGSATYVQCNEQRVSFHLKTELGQKALGSFDRNQMRSLLERQVAEGSFFSTVGHLRWDLRQSFDLAVSDGYVGRNPATVLFFRARLGGQNLEV